VHAQGRGRQGPAEIDQIREPLAVADHRGEPAHRPVQALFAQHERRQQLDHRQIVALALRQDMVVAQQRDQDQLAEQPFARPVHQRVGRPEPELTRRLELERDHHALAAHLLDRVVAREAVAQALASRR
jgi:hypothetical protein